MKLVVRTVDGARVPGRRALVLCEESGELLPGQCACTIEQVEDERSIVTVSFEIDGRSVILDGSLVEA